tara:strand:- start:465 stop:959 length:495 start_codon:yes stop_codon:yes gene_type:complete
MTFTAYSPRVARGGLSDDFSKFSGIAKDVEDQIKNDALARALKWQSSEIRKNIRGAQPVQMGASEPTMAEQLVGIGAKYLTDKGVFDQGLRGIFGGGGSDPTFGTGIPSGSNLPTGSFGSGSGTLGSGFGSAIDTNIGRHVTGSSAIQPVASGGGAWSWLPWVN